MDEAAMPSMAPIVVISGPSGAGKGTVIRRTLKLAQDNGLKVKLSVSDTTREPRAGETNGIAYNFVTAEVFLEREANGYYLESASYAGNCYGTPRLAVEEAAQSDTAVLIEIELKGARQIMSAARRGFAPRPNFVFLNPPSYEELVHRLKKRGTENSQKIEERLLIAREEIRGSKDYDFIIVNGIIDQAAGELYAILAR